MENEQKMMHCLSDQELELTGGGYVIINDAGCYELYDEKGNYRRTFRGDQLEQLRRYARQHGISDEIKAKL